MFISWDIGIKNIAWGIFDKDKIIRISCDTIIDENKKVKNFSSKVLIKYLYKYLFDTWETIFKNYDIRKIIIESQIKANVKARAIESALIMFFLTKNINFKPISPKDKFRKLKIECPKKYKDRKNKMIEIAGDNISGEIKKYFEGAKKKDDLADVIMMGITYNINLTT